MDARYFVAAEPYREGLLDSKYKLDLRYRIPIGDRGRARFGSYDQRGVVEDLLKNGVQLVNR